MQYLSKLCWLQKNKYVYHKIQQGSKRMWFFININKKLISNNNIEKLEIKFVGYEIKSFYLKTNMIILFKGRKLEDDRVKR